MSNRLARLAVVTLVASPLAACSSGASPSSSGDGATSSLNVALTQVPANVACIEIDVTGNPGAKQQFNVVSGQSSVFSLGGIGVGGVDVSGRAWNASCATSGTATPTWIAPNVSTVVTTSAVAQVTLEFSPTGSASVGADFAASSFRNVTTFAGTARQAGNVDGVGAAARFNRPQAVVSDGAGNLYVTDGKNRTIRQIVIATATVSTLAGNATATGPSVDGVGTAAVFNHPEGITYDGAGNLYVADSFDNTIRKIAVATKTVTTIAGTAGQSGTADGVGAAARFASPYGLTSDKAGNLYIADAGNDTIRKLVVATGAVTTIAGAAGVSQSLDGNGTAARFVGPVGVATDGANLYITDGSTLRTMTLSTGNVWTMAGDPNQTGASDGAVAHFGALYGITFDGNVTLYMTDVNNANVRAYRLDTGLTSTVAGSPGMPGIADGNGPAAQFSLPLGIGWDSSGALFVTDTSPSTIRKLQ
jgi:hypothetical protein